MLEETVVLGDLWSSPQASEFMNGDMFQMVEALALADQTAKLEKITD